jgi:NDP-sugar pyrophosphorylase family protein
MQAVILAGGRGTRLKPLTDAVPKVMVPVNGKPFLELLIGQLRSASIDDIVLLVGYRAEQIERHFTDGSALGVRIAYSRDEEQLGTAGALRKAGGLLAGQFFLLYGDTMADIDFGHMAAAFRASEAALMMALYCGEPREGIPPFNTMLSEDGRVLGYSKTGEMDGNCVDAGIMACSKRIIDAVPSGRAVSLEREVLPGLIRRGEVAGYRMREPFYDMGSPDGLERLARRLA